MAARFITLSSQNTLSGFKNIRKRLERPTSPARDAEVILAVKISTAEVFSRNLFARRSFNLSTPRQRRPQTSALKMLKVGYEALTHQRGSSQEDGSLLAHDDAFISHSRYVRASGSAGAHHNSNLTEAETEEV